MPSKEELREIIRRNLDDVGRGMNAALQGKDLDSLEAVLLRVGRGGVLPHWYANLKAKGTLPNLDGKTVGSVIEMLLVAVLETQTFKRVKGAPSLKINPARGVDLPDLDLGIKSPSENYCTSEPFFSAYERLLGSEHDILVLLTDYQTAKKKTRRGLRLHLLKWRYLKGSQVADENLCRIARTVRDWLLPSNEAWTKKVFRFLAYINQSDWLAKQLLRMVEVLNDETAISRIAKAAIVDYHRKNKEAVEKGNVPLPETDLESLDTLLEVKPLRLGVIDAAETWVLETQKESGRAPNDNEWQRLGTGPLDGLIGMSFALQWRYNFGKLFNGNATSLLDTAGESCDPEE